MQVVLHPEADGEAQAAALWYDEQRSGLGDEFLAELSALLERIEGAPHSFPRWSGVGESAERVCKAMLHRFPYLVAFEVHADHVLVLAVVHGKRRPLYWLARTSEPPG